MIGSVGINDHRSLSEHRFHTIRVQLCLLLTNPSIAFRALGLHESQRLAIIAPQDTINETFVLIVRHPGHFEFSISSLIQRPANFFQQQVDEIVAGLRF